MEGAVTYTTNAKRVARRKKAISVHSKRRSIIPGCCVSFVAMWYSLDPLKGFSSSVVFILASRNGVLPRSHLQMVYRFIKKEVKTLFCKAQEVRASCVPARRWRPVCGRAGQGD